jgi:hypothetical protein
MFIVIYSYSSGFLSEVYSIGIYSDFEEASRVCLKEALLYMDKYFNSCSLSMDRRREFYKNTDLCHHIPINMSGIFWNPRTDIVTNNINVTREQNLNKMFFRPTLSNQIKNWLISKYINQYFVKHDDEQFSWYVIEVEKKSYNEMVNIEFS